MRIYLASITAARSRSKSDSAGQIASEYLSRAGRYLSCESLTVDSEAALLGWLDRQSARTAPVLLLLDSRGDQLSSEDFADRLRRYRDAGTQIVVFGIGPHDGWTAAARNRAAATVSFGRMTLPHELARAVCAEQIYRALTILAGHPYHSGH